MYWLEHVSLEQAGMLLDVSDGFYRPFFWRHLGWAWDHSGSHDRSHANQHASHWTFPYVSSQIIRQPPQLQDGAAASASAGREDRRHENRQQRDVLRAA